MFVVFFDSPVHRFTSSPLVNMRFSLDEINAAAAEFLRELGNRKIVAFYGSMGAGKTTFIKAICDVLGVTDTVNSPTFAIVNEYLAASGSSIYHFDFYRIKKIEEAYDFGYEDYFYSGNLCLIEWPELIEELLPEDTVRVKIEETENGERALTLID